MSRSVFDPAYDELPLILPVFPLTGVLLLPGGRLPLNIFEPRYIAMVDDALASHRLIGMVQPTEEAEARPKLYHIGCAGRIISFSETDDGRYLITLQGLIRFDWSDELPIERDYRRVMPDFTGYRTDLEEDESDIDRDGLMEALRFYFNATGIDGDWEAIESAPNEHLITSLAMGCPFAPSEKQALLEAATLPDRSDVITTILSMAAHTAQSQGASN